ncbi:hypothetical protein EB796_001869 [Bugula neritina]|uniref:acid phosphatase n=1 Tax=Bugula neritina TaxID=10212 RepID=A0A7J7KP31_BUGNE|nr:hypothetical protein EB796_001869 [Bugula neritina]
MNGLLSQIVVLLVTNSATQVSSSSLIVANVLFRHGDRSPTAPLPKNQYSNESYWPFGWGELTNTGREQQYRLGLFLRQRYDSVIDDVFNYKNIEVRSSDVDRCLVSAYSNLAGLFSSNNSETEDLKLPWMTWQPLPVHTQPAITDEVSLPVILCHIEYLA